MIYEVFILKICYQTNPDPTAMMVFAGMIGLSVWQKEKETPTDPEPPTKRRKHPPSESD